MTNDEEMYSALLEHGLLTDEWLIPVRTVSLEEAKKMFPLDEEIS
jgi:hypothetical protein